MTWRMVRCCPWGRQWWSYRPYHRPESSSQDGGARQSWRHVREHRVIGQRTSGSRFATELRNMNALASDYGGDGKIVGRCGTRALPIVEYPAHWAPLSMLFYTETQFPEQYEGGLFIAFHGSRLDTALPTRADGSGALSIPDTGKRKRALRGSFSRLGATERDYFTKFVTVAPTRSRRDAEYSPCALRRALSGCKRTPAALSAGLSPASCVESRNRNTRIWVHGSVVSCTAYVLTSRNAPARCASRSIGSATSRMYRVYSANLFGLARQKYTCASVASPVRLTATVDVRAAVAQPAWREIASRRAALRRWGMRV